MATAFEIADTRPDLKDVLYAFQGAPMRFPPDEARDRVRQSGVFVDEADGVLELLLWFGFLGVTANEFPEPKYAHDVQANIRRLLFPISQGDGSYVIHPAFRAALDIDTDT